MKNTLFYFFILVVLSCSTSEQEIVSEDVETEEEVEDIGEIELFDMNAEFQLLFVGNSLTQYNNLPGLVKKIYNDTGKSVSISTILKGGTGLEDHWNSDQLQPEINSGFYDYVIVQQGPSSQEYGRWSLMTFGGLIAESCNENSAQLAFFMVWPSRTYYSTFDGVITNYTDAAEATNSILCPVGQVWKHHFDQTEDFSYYGPDGFHPSLKGSQVAAEVIVQSLGIH